RPIPSGQISVKQAWGFLIACCVISFAILLTLGLIAIALGVGSLALVAAYPFMKRITWWPQAWLGLTFNWGALVGFAAASHTLSAGALLLYAAGIAWTLGYDTIYAIQDIEDDALVGVKSSARRLGSRARWGVLAFYAAAAALVVAAARLAGVGPLFLPFAGLFALHLSWQASRVSIDDPALALRLFKSNREAGLIIFAGLVAGLWPGGAGVL
ncbi:MAG: UbiA family prenyltransferase, partial [Alphaproteobacteria bacterium]